MYIFILIQDLMFFISEFTAEAACAIRLSVATSSCFSAEKIKLLVSFISATIFPSEIGS